MKKFKLKSPRYSFDHKGMIIQGELRSEGHIVDVYARDICNYNMDVMNKMNIRQCMVKGNDFKWVYDLDELDELEPLEPIKVTFLDYEMLKFLQKQGVKYICRDKGGLINLYEKEPHIMDDDRTWWAGGETCYLGNFLEQLFQFVKWEDKKYYVIKELLENCEVIE